MIDDESDKSMKEDEVTVLGREESEIERLVVGCRGQAGSCLLRQDEAYRKERLVISNHAARYITNMRKNQQVIAERDFEKA